jgi:hypothetical protein
MVCQIPPTTTRKLSLFRARFTGLPNVYGTYDLVTGRARQVKQAVTDRVLLAHLQGKQPYGVYLLVKDRTRAVVADFDVDDLEPPLEFLASAKRYGLEAYIERSKSKGYHVWMFLAEAGVSAAKARLVMRHILEEIGQPNTEVFPKHDRLDTRTTYGNYIYAPLFGALVPQGRTVFLDPRRGLTPSADQWQLLENVVRVREGQLDEIIEINELDLPDYRATPASSAKAPAEPWNTPGPVFGLPPCARHMLTEGVGDHQRVTCFRLAVQLKKAGLPEDIAVGALRAWAAKNRPNAGRRIITEQEISEQTACAYARPYRACGCDEPAVQPFCEPWCAVRGYAATVESPETESTPSSERSNAMSDPAANRPVKELRVRNIRLSIWQHEGTRDGQAVMLHSVTLNKRYRDSSTGEWTDSGSFFPDDLPRLRLLLDKAYEFLMLRDVSPDQGTNASNAPAAAPE